MKTFWITILAGMTVGLSCQAEYRVFRLEISKRPAPSAAQGQPPPPPAGRVVLSTLDPRQYREYYHIDPSERVIYTRTWRCFGETGGFKELCPDPKPLAANQPGTQVPGK